ncbi:MAG: phosphatase PAP2 family protein [Actinomycetota bacterium]|nr:phosphatase PAP2 family protein [Actinomycetota bacterium]
MKLVARLAGRALRGEIRRRRRTGWQAVRWPFLAYLPFAVGLAMSRRRIGFPRPLTIPLVSATPLAVSLALPKGTWRYAGVWATYMWLFKVAWEVPYDQPEKLGERLRIRYAMRVDSLVGGGVPLTVRLQRALRDPGRVNALDVAMTASYYVLFAAPHGVLMWLLVRGREDDFVRLAGRLAATLHLTTVGYWILPGVPPWWASEKEGEMDGAVHRVVREVEDAVKARLPARVAPSGGGDEVLTEGNPWASMPSDHFAAAATTAICMAEVGPAAGAVGWTGAALAGFAIVYLGEHYVMDILAGLAIAEGVRRVEPVAVPLLRAGNAGLGVIARLAD